MTFPAYAHILELRHAVGSSLTRDELLDRDSTLIRELEACKLLTWDGGAGLDDGRWVTLRPGALVVTPAGHAVLASYDLGCQRPVADAMGDRISEIEAALRDAVTGQACWIPRAIALLARSAP